MHSVHLCKPKECAVVLPGIWQDFFIPVIGHFKVSILVVCLPCVTCQGDEASLVVLQINSAVFYPNLNITNIDPVSQMGKILFEQLDNICMYCLPSGNNNSIGGMSSDGNHLFESCIFEGLYGLHVHVRQYRYMGKTKGTPGEFQPTIGWLHLEKGHWSMVPPTFRGSTVRYLPCGETRYNDVYDRLCHLFLSRNCFISISLSPGSAHLQNLHWRYFFQEISAGGSKNSSTL